jgi:2-oxoglutarate/2-oxoacid ferredoxin oxidoreductase subunit alpha
MPQRRTLRDSVSFAIVGTGGAGAVTAGAILLEAAGKSGWYGLMNLSVGPQIRGGEAAALVRLASDPAECMSKEFDILVAIDWKNADRFLGDMPLVQGGLVFADPAAGETPEVIAEEVAEVALKDLAKDIPGGRENMITVGIVAQLIGLSLDGLMQVVSAKLSSKGKAVVAASRASILVGMKQAGAFGDRFALTSPRAAKEKRWLITGNEAVGLGALRGGVRFAAAYPITPATEVLEYLAPALASVGGALVQAEDELSSINMAIGASFGGRPSITATSGPGLALMMEALGLSAASETPIVVVDVMRAGPSTGIATKSEQSDLNIAVYGFHGDAPHVVVAPLSVADCLFTTQWAVHMAEALQSPVIVLSDQSLGQTRVLIDKPADVSFFARRTVWHGSAQESYARYALTANGVSPMALPGMPGGQYTADGLTHGEIGHPSSRSVDQKTQMDKRQRKIEGFDYGDHWGLIEGTGKTVILTWGSLTGAAREAMTQLGGDIKLITLRQISPFPLERLKDALDGASRVLVVEQSHSGQFHRYLRAFIDLPADTLQLNREGPSQIGPDEIADTLKNWKSQ